jgi:hypothetical protein
MCPASLEKFTKICAVTEGENSCRSCHDGDDADYRKASERQGMSGSAQPDDVADNEKPNDLRHGIAAVGEEPENSKRYRESGEPDKFDRRPPESYIAH